MSKTTELASLGRYEWTRKVHITHPTAKIPQETSPHSVVDTEDTAEAISRRCLFSRQKKKTKGARHPAPSAVTFLGIALYRVLLTSELLENETQDNALPVLNSVCTKGVRACAPAYADKEHKDV